MNTDLRKKATFSYYKVFHITSIGNRNEKDRYF